MAKVVDITEKLSYEDNPIIKIRNKELEVNADAATMLKIMGILSEGETGPKKILEMYDLLFTEGRQKEIEQLKLNFKDLQEVIYTAIDLITGEDKQGE